jgi:hypothetical protein
MAVPFDVCRLVDIESCLHATLAFLLAAEDLTFISVWSPSFLTLLLERLEQDSTQIIDDLGSGQLRLDERNDPSVRYELSTLLGRHPVRANQVERILLNGSPHTKSVYEHLWPKLQLISCWTSGAARGAAKALRILFPTTPLAPEGDIRPDHYVLFLAGEKPPSDREGARAQQKLETLLSENFQYSYCRKLGQLNPSKISWIEGGLPSHSQLFAKPEKKSVQG